MDRPILTFASNSATLPLNKPTHPDPADEWHTRSRPYIAYFMLDTNSYIAYVLLMRSETARLTEWETTLGREIQRLQSERERVDSELQRATKKLELVKQMRLLEGGSAPGATPAVIAPKERRATPTAVREMAQKVLSESARPLHISEIHEQFVARGYAIPGSGTPFNILAHLVNDKSFVRVARGTYALAGSVPPEQVLPRAERKTRRRRRKAKKSETRPRVAEA